MEWLLFSLLTALLDAGKDFMSKTLLHRLTPQSVALSIRWFSLPFLWPLLWLDHPAATPLFWQAGLASALLNAVAITVYMRAISQADLSLVVPLTALSPVLLLITSPLMIGEMPSLAGVGGVVLVVAGTWWLKVGEAGHGVLAPWRALWRESGARYMLLATVIYGVSANLDKMAIGESTALYYAVVVVTMEALMLAGFALVSRWRWPQGDGVPWGGLWLLGGITAAMIASNMVAFSLGMVAYVIVIKRFSVLIGVLVGAGLFQETGLRQRLTGAGLLLLGLVVVAVAG